MPPVEYHDPKDLIKAAAIVLVWVVAFLSGAYAAYSGVSDYYHLKSAVAKRI